MTSSERIGKSFNTIWRMAFVFASLAIVPIVLLETRAPWAILIPLVGSIVAFIVFKTLSEFPQIAPFLLNTWQTANRPAPIVGAALAKIDVSFVTLKLKSYLIRKFTAPLFDDDERLYSSLKREYVRQLTDNLRHFDVERLSSQAAQDFTQQAFTLLLLRTKYLIALGARGKDELVSSKVPNVDELLVIYRHAHEAIVSSEMNRMMEMLAVSTESEMRRMQKLVSVQTIHLRDLLALMHVETRLLEKLADHKMQ